MRTRAVSLFVVVLMLMLGTLVASPGGVRAVDPATPPATEIPLPASFLANQLYSARVSTNGRFVLATTSGGTSIRYDLATGAAIDLPFPQRPQAISADGRYVAMSGGIRRDVTTGTDLQMTVPPGLTVPGSSIPINFHIGSFGSGPDISMSDDGNRIAYQVISEDFQVLDVLVYDVTTGQTYQALAGAPVRANLNYLAVNGSLSADGRYLAYEFINDPGTCAGGTATCIDVLIKDLSTGVVTRVSNNVAGEQSKTGGSFSPTIAPGGGAVVFASTDTDLVVPSTPVGETNVFVWTRASNSIVRVPVPTGFSLDTTQALGISADGHLVVFTAVNTSYTARAVVADVGIRETTLMDSPFAGLGEGIASISSFGNFALVISAQNDAPVYKQAKLFKVALVATDAFKPLAAPARLLDTRPGSTTVDGLFAGGGIRPGGSILELNVAGRGGVPPDASAAVLNITVTQPATAGFVTAFPCGVEVPTASNLNFVAGDTIPNAVIAKIGTSGKVCLFTNVPTHLIADVAGYFG
ncbi:MAG: hypothetical protein QOJ66_185 [Ilumatobacteraceae bacterium]